jgi:hypothetical protein
LNAPKGLHWGADDWLVDDLRNEFQALTQRCNAGTATADEYERWCGLRAELRRTDLPTRRMKRREWPRAECNIMVDLRIGRVLRTVRCIDFGPGGLGLEVPESIQPRTPPIAA